MTALLLFIGFVILSAVLADIFVTTLTTRGAGFLTGRLLEALWRVALWLHRRRPSHRLLANAGPLLSASLLLIWVLGLWAGWSFVFNAATTAVVDAKTGQPADVWSRIYYAGFTLFTLGLGDYRPNGAPWQILSAICVANGLLIITLSVTYLVPVVSAVSRKRQLASSIASLGMRPAEILATGWYKGSFDRLVAQLGGLSGNISELAQQHLAYPALHYFHSADEHTALGPRLAALDEALRLLRYAVASEARPAEIDLRPLAGSLQIYTDALATAHVSPAAEAPPMPSLAFLQERGIPLASMDEIEAGFRPDRRHRRMLLALVRHDGWDWPGDGTA
ncbi:MAG TPA: ion channel [Afifellaceae bacterium]|nr:ion channel [Afifellaceae bacterium]